MSNSKDSLSELQKIAEAGFGSRESGKTWYGYDPKVIHDTEQKRVRIMYDRWQIDAITTDDGLQELDSPTHGPILKAVLIPITSGVIIGDEGSEDLVPGRYIVLTDRFVYGSPLGWRGRIDVTGLSA